MEDLEHSPFGERIGHEFGEPQQSACWTCIISYIILRPPLRKLLLCLLGCICRLALFHMEIKNLLVICDMLRFKQSMPPDVTRSQPLSLEKKLYQVLSPKSLCCNQRTEELAAMHFTVLRNSTPSILSATKLPPLHPPCESPLTTGEDGVS